MAARARISQLASPLLRSSLARPIVLRAVRVSEARFMVDGMHEGIQADDTRK